MPVQFEYLDNNQGVLIRAFGSVEGSDFLNNMQKIFSDGETIRNYRYGIVDYTGLERFNITHDQIYALAKIHIDASKINPSIAVGFVITKPIIYGLVRIWMAYANSTGWKVNIKKDFPSIRKWIDETLHDS